MQASYLPCHARCGETDKSSGLRQKLKDKPLAIVKGYIRHFLNKNQFGTICIKLCSCCYITNSYFRSKLYISTYSVNICIHNARKLKS